MDTITFKTETAVEMTPEVLARLFAELDDTKQADFFEEVGRIAEEDWKHGQMQWCYLGDRLRERGTDSHAWRFAADIGAFTMLNTWRYFGSQHIWP